MAMAALLDTNHLQDVISDLREEGTRNLKASRHSFITTPANLGARFLNQLHPEQQPLTWLDLVKISLFLLWRIHLTFMSLLAIYAVSLAIAAVGNMSEWRITRPPEDQVRAITTGIGMFHLTMVFTLSVLWGFELPISYPWLLVYSIAGIVGTFICGMVGGVLLIAGWKMLKVTWERMYWPGRNRGNDAAEQTEKRRAPQHVNGTERVLFSNVEVRNPSLLDENGDVREELIDVPDQAG